MSDDTLHALVNELAEAMETRAWKEFTDYLEVAERAAASAGGFANYDVSYDDYASPVDPYQLFQPFLDMPLAEDFDGEIAQLRNVRQNIGDAYIRIDDIRADASTWVSAAGDYFNEEYVPLLKEAATAHVSLLEELEQLLLTYRDLLREAWKAAKQLCQRLIEKVNEPDAAVDFDFRTLLNLGLAVAGALALTVKPEVGFALLLAGANAGLSLADAGNAVVREISVHGSTVREVMDSGQTAVGKLKTGLKAKGNLLARVLEGAPGVIGENSARLMPAGPAMPES